MRGLVAGLAVFVAASALLWLAFKAGYWAESYYLEADYPAISWRQVGAITVGSYVVALVGIGLALWAAVAWYNRGLE